jgi:hypothetical protein
MMGYSTRPMVVVKKRFGIGLNPVPHCVHLGWTHVVIHGHDSCVNISGRMDGFGHRGGSGWGDVVLFG